MILIFDFFETLLNIKKIDFNCGLKPLWEKHYKDKCSFEDICKFGEELFVLFQNMHKEGKEFPFVKDELPLYAEKYGGEVVSMTTEEEADFLMLCNDMEHIPGVKDMLDEFEKERIPMYVLSNSGFTAKSLWVVLDRFGIGQYFSNVWSSADYGKIKPCREFFDMAINAVLLEHPEERKEEILFIGDTYSTDIIGAYDAGIKAVWINRKKEEDTLRYATYQIAETSGLFDIVYKRKNNVRKGK
jgi:putative hydrolase of the HAD superfamily